MNELQKELYTMINSTRAAKGMAPVDNSFVDMLLNPAQQKLSDEMTHKPQQKPSNGAQTFMNYIGDVVSGRIAKKGLNDLAANLNRAHEDPSALQDYIGFGGIGTIALKAAKIAKGKQAFDAGTEAKLNKLRSEFENSQEWNHGSNKSISEFDSKFLGSSTGDTETGRFLSKVAHFGSSDESTAIEYAKNAVSKRGGVPTVNKYLVSSKGQAEISGSDLMPHELAATLLDAKDNGVRSVIIRGVRDTISGEKTDIIAILDETAVRSKNAKFLDPKSANWMAGLAGLGIGLQLYDNHESGNKK